MKNEIKKPKLSTNSRTLHVLLLFEQILTYGNFNSPYGSFISHLREFYLPPKGISAVAYSIFFFAQC